MRLCDSRIRITATPSPADSVRCWWVCGRDDLRQPGTILPHPPQPIRSSPAATRSSLARAREHASRLARRAPPWGSIGIEWGASAVAHGASRDAGEGIRTLEPLQERILSPPLLARLSHPRAVAASRGGIKHLSDTSHQSTESVPSPCGSGAISSSVRRSITWITPRSFFAGHTSAARTFSSRSSSPM